MGFRFALERGLEGPFEREALFIGQCVIAAIADDGLPGLGHGTEPGGDIYRITYDGEVRPEAGAHHALDDHARGYAYAYGQAVVIGGPLRHIHDIEGREAGAFGGVLAGEYRYHLVAREFIYIAPVRLYDSRLIFQELIQDPHDRVGAVPLGAVKPRTSLKSRLLCTRLGSCPAASDDSVPADTYLVSSKRS